MDVDYDDVRIHYIIQNMLNGCRRWKCRHLLVLQNILVLFTKNVAEI